MLLLTLAALHSTVLLRMAGYDVHLAYDGKGAVESVQKLHPHAVLLDIGLPGMDGYQVAERIRADPGSGNTRFFRLRFSY